MKALSRLVFDERLADVELEGSDGLRFCTHRGLLAARSPVFDRMFYGDFCESINNNNNANFAGDNSSLVVIHIGYPTRVLKSIVQYCMTDTAELLQNNDDDDDDNNNENSNDDSDDDNDTTKLLPILADAANFFQLPVLQQKIKQRGQALMENDKSTVCYFLEGSTRTATTSSSSSSIIGSEESLWKIARHYVQAYPQETLLETKSSIVGYLSKYTWKDLLQDDMIGIEECVLFRALDRWANSCTDDDDDDDDALDDGDEEAERRRKEALELSQYISLQDIPPDDLVQYVEGSKIITHEQLCQAFKGQALRAQKEQGVVFGRHRVSPVVWKSTQSLVYSPTARNSRLGHVEKLHLPNGPMKSGIWEWTIFVEQAGSGMRLGLVAAGEEYITFFPSLLFRNGSIVTLTLDLSHDTDHQGSFSTRFDGGPLLMQGTGMRRHLHHGFVPAAKMMSGTVRLLHCRGTAAGDEEREVNS